MLDGKANIFRDLVALNKPANKSSGPSQKMLSPHIGYVNIFPIFFGLVQKNTTYFTAVLELLADRNQIWSDYGLRSLSQSDSYFRQGDAYWTEPIWIPMNYLALRGLKLFYFDVPEVQEIYKALRENLLENMQKTWHNTRNFWENYDSFDGHGKGFPSFTGWTTLITLIYSEQY
jgi:mannosyl-oligosaccharide glucosidase